MVPSAFVVLGALPLTPNGKVDRKALPAPEHGGDAAAYVAPRDMGEDKLARIWQEVLKVERVGVRDNFFELGGHSLLATQVVSRIRKELSTELALRELFEAPTVEQLAARIRNGAGRRAVAPVIVARARGKKPLPLSFAQERLWFLDQLEPGSAAYNMPAALRLRGRLDVSALARSIAEVVRRHEALRTTFEIGADGAPVQVIHAEERAQPGHVNLRALSPSERESRAREEAAREAQAPFDLKDGPLVRAKLLELGDEEHVLLFTTHHIVSDGWSVGVLVGELTALYAAFVSGKASPLLELAIQYADYAAWQRDWLRGEELERQASYWKKQMAGASVAIHLPTDRPRPPVQTFAGATLEMQLSKETSRRIDELSRKLGATPFMVLLAAFDVLLSRHSGQDDIVVGTPIANRNRMEIEGLIGFFVNTLAIRADLSGEPTFSELVARVKETTLDAYAQQDLPFEKLVDLLQVERDMSRNPLFQVMFVLQNAPRAELEMGGLALSPLAVASTVAKFDLRLDMSATPDGYVAAWEHNTDLFDLETIERMVAHFETLLEGALTDPDACVTELPLMTDSEKRRVLVEWNATNVAYTDNLWVHERFEREARDRPDAVAVVFESETVSYGALNTRANAVAGRLRESGVEAGQLVGVFMERSVEMVAALLGIVKSGAAYVPIDPDYPEDRINYMLEDSGARVVLTQSALVERLKQGLAICLDTEPAGDSPDENPVRDVKGSSLAYVIYTSGSTGRPKGAMNTHEGLRNRLLWMQDTYRLGVEDAVLQKTSFSFDVSVWEFFWPLMVGARLVVARPGGHKDRAYLCEVIAREKVTTMHFVPSMLQVFLEEPAVAQCVSLKRVICSGEVLPFELTKRFHEKSRAELHNLYGPTEAAIDVSWWQCRTDDSGPSVPIGRPIANTSLYVLDPRMQPVPIGASGELFIGGVQLARGYWRRPELTADRFVPNPFGGARASRLYRTGDVARYLRNGAIEYVGRSDHQVKLRGFRIELGEIEASLEEHPEVRQCIVLMREDVAGDPRLVAYLVVDSERAGEPGQGGSEASARGRVEEWSSVFDQQTEDLHEVAQATDAVTFKGWNSSYTHEPIPVEDMSQWLTDTVDRIACARPRRLLELGVGTGALLFRLAPDSDAYYGTDISEQSLRHVTAHLSALGDKKSVVSLARRSADDLAGIADESFDVVIVNSVIQYFPSVDYLVDVLEGAIRAVRPGGRVFIGDVRSMRLLELFHTSVELARASATLPRASLRERVRHQVRLEKELTIDPTFFVALAERFPRIGHVEIEPKRGRYDNELTRFRYDVTLHIGHAPEPVPIESVAWKDIGMPMARYVEAHPASRLVIRGVPNARTTADLLALETLKADQGPATAGEMRQALGGAGLAAVHPEDVWALGGELPYHVGVSWAAGAPDGSFDVILIHRSAGGRADHAALTAFDTRQGAKPWREYANNPLKAWLDAALVARLRASLGEKLPEYMAPSAYVLVDALPLTPNGKVDRNALLAPEGTALVAEYVAPRNETEEALGQIWCELLHVERVGGRDNFFDLGGHSLLAMRLLGRIQERFGIALAVRTLFEAPTLVELAKQIEQHGEGSTAKRTASSLPLVLLRAGSPTSVSSIVFVHAIGGSAFVYDEIARMLPGDAPVFGLQAPGLLGERAPIRSVVELATVYAAAIEASASSFGRVHLVGWSFGGLVAVEVARLLALAGREAVVTTIDTLVRPQASAAAPEIPFLMDFCATVRMAPRLDQLNPIVEGAESERRERIIELLAPLLGGVEPVTHAMDVYESNLVALSTHRVERWGGRVNAIGAGRAPDPAWSEVAASTTEHVVPGADHYSVIRSPFAEQVAALIGKMEDS
jgi:amino acid adenylation domain-containing protein